MILVFPIDLNAGGVVLNPTNISDPNYYHKVVDCQWACPAHTPVPEYIRLIAQYKFDEAYKINWESNLLPGILGRVCDRPCEPACRRGRVDEEPVAICRLKRVAADNKNENEVSKWMPTVPSVKSGKRVVLIGAGPASLAVARDLLPLGYDVTLIDREHAGGGLIRTQIPSFRLPESVLNEEVDRVIDMGIKTQFNTEVKGIKSLFEYDAIFVGSGAPKARSISLPGLEEGAANIHLGIDWLTGVTFEHIQSIGKRVIVLGGGNTAMDCCRTALRLGSENVKVVVRSGYEEMKASPWEKDDAIQEGIPIINNHVPKSFVVKNGKLIGLEFDKVSAVFDDQGNRTLVSLGEPLEFIACDDVIVAVGQENAFPWIEEDSGIEFNQYGIPVVDEITMNSTHEKVFFGGDSAFGPKNIIWAVAHGRQAAISIDLFCQGKDMKADRPVDSFSMQSEKMGLHEWGYDNHIDERDRNLVPHADLSIAVKDISMEVELGYDESLALKEANRCLNCDIQTVFTESLCKECDACVDICPTDCITFTDNGEELELRNRLLAKADNTEQSLLVSEPLKTQRVMVKNEDFCLHCGLCAERCPTIAWDMQKSTLNFKTTGASCIVKV
ncbi:MAG: FAD-dependent oxidoreductase [Pseudomonadales bacterium]|nr:FAD-dependent oxidoreductase [Pseudomonadales bacterium]